MWNKILIRVLNGEKIIQSPYAFDGNLEYEFILVDEQRNLGYILIWCNKTFKGIQISRVKIPENCIPINIDELDNRKLPDIDLQDVSFV